MSTWITQSIVLLIGLNFYWVTSVETAAQQESKVYTISVPYKTRSYVGKPVVWDGKDLMLLRRDGKISILPVKSESDYTTIGTGFKPYSSLELRQRLQKEFGAKYQVSVSPHFVVVHPPGSYNVWAAPFEELYGRFHAYFRSRGMQLESPDFPMVAVVLRTRGEFDRFLTTYHSYDRQVLGYYNPRSNRIITYDQAGGKSRSKEWFFNTSTIIHEATHQTAFNTGLHSRYAPVPRWISEGLAMLFEAKGVNNSMYYGKQEDRINRDRLVSLKRFYQQGAVKGKLRSLILSDDLFRSNPQLAYALSWGTTFYLSEKRPTKYMMFLKNDASRSDFQGYSSKQRAQDFARVFGNDVRGLEARMEQFFTDLKVPSRK